VDTAVRVAVRGPAGPASLSAGYGAADALGRP
jgi:hypothetical protein